MFSNSMKRGVIVVVLFLIFIALASTVYAFGVSTPYLENDTLRVLPGQNYTYTITIQNGDEEGYYVDIIYSSTNDIAKMVTKEYYVPAKTYNNTFQFDIQIPSDAEMESNYILEYSAKPRVDNIGTIPLGVEIRRSINIVVTDGKNTNIQPTVSSVPAKETVRQTEYNTDHNQIFQSTWKYIVAAIVIALIIFIGLRVWKLSKGLSVKLGNRRLTNHTISQAINLNEVKILLQKISDEEYELPEIRKIFKNKLSELTNNEIVEEIPRISRREAIIALDHILK